MPLFPKGSYLQIFTLFGGKKETCPRVVTWSEYKSSHLRSKILPQKSLCSKSLMWEETLCVLLFSQFLLEKILVPGLFKHSWISFYHLVLPTRHAYHAFSKLTTDLILPKSGRFPWVNWELDKYGDTSDIQNSKKIQDLSSSFPQQKRERKNFVYDLHFPLKEKIKAKISMALCTAQVLINMLPDKNSRG